ncbi:unnamed protein product [Eruca vesicaria subsp. sativa]|uniref:J domain-containing protein n=1 Tax=Eruca vesicaria subsp. sativa TaxID=29727 RepID=A0ABC8JC93_ERUVS|nr:unnamed protein product [Eruca vesicaria subsp. sativa]
MMSGGGNGGGGNGGDPEQWLITAQKLLLSGDLNGSKTYAIRACEADHSLVDPAELILAVADTLIAGESRIRADLPDWYAVLRLVRLTHNPELVATQYSRLAVLLNPSRNRFPYSDQAFRLVSDAWYVLSDPSRKALYDREVHLSQFGQLGQLGFQLLNQPPPPESSPQQQQQEESPQHQTVSYQNQLPFQLHQHFGQPQEQRAQFSSNNQQVMQQQFGQEQGEMIRSGGSSSSSGRDWRLPVEEERSINLNNATERVQPSRRFHDQERSSSGRSYEEASSQRAPNPPSTDLTWASKPTPTSEPIALQHASQFQAPRSNQAAQLSLLSLVSDQPSVSQQNRAAQTQTQTHSVSKPQPVSKLFPMSQPSSNPLAGTGLREAPRPFAVSKQPTASKPFSGSQSSQKSKPFATSQPPTTSKPSGVSQRSLNSNPFPVSEPPRTSNPFPVSQPTPNTKASLVSQPPQTSSNPFRVSQQPPSSRPVPVSQPQQPPSSSNPFLVSQPTTASKPLPGSQQPTVSKPMQVTQPSQQAFQSTSHSQPPEASGGPSPQPHIFNSAQSFQPQPVSITPPPVPAVSTTPSQVPVGSTNPSPPQPTGVTNQTQHNEQTPSSDSNQKVASFWTTCPYCFVLFEYPNMYEESVLKCQTKSCRRAFQAVKVPSPPPVAEEDSYYCCWGFYPIGFAETAKAPVHDLPRGFPVHDLHNRSGFPVPVYNIPRTVPKKAARKVYYNEDEEDDEYIDSDPSEDDDDDDDWHVSGIKKRKNVKQSKQKASTRPRKVIVVD